MSAWNSRDEAAANAEGWGLFECFDAGHPPIELQRIDDDDVFADDEAAWEHVLDRAAEGSALHRRAIDYLAVESPEEHARVLGHALADQAEPMTEA